MKKIAFCVLLGLALVGCHNTNTKNCIKPLPSGIDLNKLTDATVPAVFTASDFNWADGLLTFTVASEDLYDAVDVNAMTVGDTLIYAGDTIVVNEIEKKDGCLTINKGLEEGGAYLNAYEGGTYRAVQMDDHSFYTKLGQVQLPLSENFMLILCGENPTDPYDTIRTEHKQYLSNLEEWKRSFYTLNTQVEIENGKVTRVIRRWIP